MENNFYAIKNRDRLERAAKIRIDRTKRAKKLDIEYDEYIKKNGGWPTAKKEQVVQRHIKHYE